MASEGVEINSIPSSIGPRVMVLNIITVVIAVNVEADACVVLTGDGDPVNVEGGLLGRMVGNFLDCAKTTTLAVTSGEKVSIDVETCGKREVVVNQGVVLVSADPDGAERAVDVAKTRGDDRDKIRIGWHAGDFTGASTESIKAADGGGTVRVPAKATTVADPPERGERGYEKKRRSAATEFAASRGCGVERAINWARTFV